MLLILIVIHLFGNLFSSSVILEIAIEVILDALHLLYTKPPLWVKSTLCHDVQLTLSHSKYMFESTISVQIYKLDIVLKLEHIESQIF